MPSHLTVCLCGVSIDAMTMSDVIAHIKHSLDTNQSLAISVVNVAKIVNMRRDALLRESVESGDLILADGAPIVWLSKFKKNSLPERVAGIDLMFELFTLANTHRLRVFFLGAKPETLDKVVQIAHDQYPQMVIAGQRDGYFSDKQSGDVANVIKDSHADILLVAMSSPKKELFMKQWSNVMNVPICHGVGGSFDVMAGVARRAPRWMQRTGLEWFYRFLQEPRRMWKRYLITNSIFLVMAAKEIFRPSTPKRMQSVDPR